MRNMRQCVFFVLAEIPGKTRTDNWQIQKMSKQLNEVGFVYELVHFYSRGADNAGGKL